MEPGQLFLGYVAPLILVLLAIPLALEMVPRNRFYGFRTPKTLSSDAIWYAANRYAGVCLLIAGLGVLAANFVILSRAMALSAEQAHRGMVASLSAGVLFATVLSFLKLRKL